jgi:hypothetical protein
MHILIKKVIVALLAQFEMPNVEPTATSLEQGVHFQNVHLPTKEGIRRDKNYKIISKRYRQLVGTFIFIYGTCRPDIMYTENMLSQSMTNPSYKHFDSTIHTR